MPADGDCAPWRDNWFRYPTTAFAPLVAFAEASMVGFVCCFMQCRQPEQHRIAKSL
jgi:hypothetical protein